MTQEEFFKRYTYSIRTDKIGGGAFGTVYKAYDNILNREVAIKGIGGENKGRQRIFPISSSFATRMKKETKQRKTGICNAEKVK